MNSAKIRQGSILSFYEFLSSRFVVIASQYRGNDGGRGKEELGGQISTTSCPSSLWPSLLGYIDMRNIFMYGVSRGGMTTYIALKHGAPVNAPLLGSITDLQVWAEWRPEMMQSTRI